MSQAAPNPDGLVPSSFYLPTILKRFCGVFTISKGYHRSGKRGRRLGVRHSIDVIT